MIWTRLHPVWHLVQENIANVAALMEVQEHACVDMDLAHQRAPPRL